MIGRERELRLLGDTLIPGEVVALVGPSGVGKTALAAQFVDEFDGPTLVVDCFGLSATAAAEAVARAAKVDPEHSEAADLWVRTAERFSSEALVVLDDVSFDFESLRPFRSAFGGRLLLTMHAISEDVVRLPMGGLEVCDLGEFAGSDAFALFVDTAKRANLNFVVTEDDVVAIHEIARRVDGFPLALCLAGRRAASTSVATVLQLLDEGDGLTDPARPQRHRSLAAALRFSWDTLGPKDQRRMYLMALFSRPLPPAMLAELGDEPLAECLDGIHRLVGRGMVSHGRFPRPLEAFVDVARTQYEMREPEDAASLVRRIGQRGLELAREQPRGLDEHVDVNGDAPSLWNLCLGRDNHGLSEPELAVVLGAWLRWVTVRGNTFEQLVLAPHVQALIERLDDWNAWYTLARHRISEPVEAMAFIDRSLAVAADDRERCESHLLRGYLHVQLGHLDEAKEEIDRARTLGDLPPIGHAFVAEMLVMGGDKDGACKELAHLDDATFGPVSAGYVQTLRAWLAPTDVEALREQQKAVDLCVRTGQRRSEAAARHSLAVLLAHRFGRYEDALHQLDKVRAITERAGNHRFANRARASAAAVLVLNEEYEDAAQIVEEIVGTGDPAVDDYCYLLWLISQWQLGQRDLVRKEWARKQLTRPPPAVPPQDEAWAVFDVAVAISHDLELAEHRREEHCRHMPEVSTLLDAMVGLAKLQPAADFKSKLRAWADVRQVRERLDGSLGTQLCWRLLLDALPDDMRPFADLEEMTGELRILEDYHALIAGDEWFDLSNQPVSQRLLRILVEATEPLDHDAVGAALYPDEIVIEDAMKNRIDVQVSKLRKLGLRPFLAKRPEGFVLEGDVVVGA